MLVSQNHRGVPCGTPASRRIGQAIRKTVHHSRLGISRSAQRRTESGSQNGDRDAEGAIQVLAGADGEEVAGAKGGAVQQHRDARGRQAGWPSQTSGSEDTPRL